MGVLPRVDSTGRLHLKGVFILQLEYMKEQGNFYFIILKDHQNTCQTEWDKAVGNKSK